MSRRGILTDSQRNAMRSEYRNLTYHPSKMRGDIREQIEALEDDLRILRQYDRELYREALAVIESVRAETNES